jgi:hypothetical protein
MTSPVVTEFRHSGATVTLTTETVTLKTGETVPARFIVVGSSGYRAILPACGCERKPCANRSESHLRGYTDHHRTHCHATFGQFHEVQAERLAANVLKTYPKRARKAVVA